MVTAPLPLGISLCSMNLTLPMPPGSPDATPKVKWPLQTNRNEQHTVYSLQMLVNRRCRRGEQAIS